MSCNANKINVGDLITLEGKFKVENVLTDPTSVTLKVKDPDGTVVTFSHPSTISKVSTGVFTKDYTVAKAGLHEYWWVGTGTCQAVESRSFVALPGVPA